MFKNVFFYLFFSLFLLNVSAQKLEYEMFLMGDKIGTLVTEKKGKGRPGSVYPREQSQFKNLVEAY